VLSILTVKEQTGGDDESGAALIFGIFLIALILFFGILMVDLLLMERTALTIQRTADAASLAAASVLSPDRDDPFNEDSEDNARNSWRAAKVTAYQMLLENYIYGTGEDLPASITDASSGICTDTTDLNHDNLQCIQWTTDSARYTIERGLYYESGGELIFLSLEDIEDCCSEVCCEAGSDCAQFFQVQCASATPPNDALQPPLIANGVRVSIEVSSLPAIFSRTIGVNISSTGPITRDSISAIDPY